MKFRLSALLSTLIMTNSISAATLIDLQQQPANYLQRFALKTSLASQTILEKNSSHTDLNQTTHTRIQQKFNNIPVWHATAVIHTPKTNANEKTFLFNANNRSTMNGVVYEGIEKDLSNTPAYALSDEQKTKALQQLKSAFNGTNKRVGVKYHDETVNKVIFVDENNQARYAYLVSFYADDGQTGAQRPTAIMDATSLKIYQRWDQVKHIKIVRPVKNDPPEIINAGGMGGNEKIGAIAYDGTTENRPALNMDSYKTDIEVLPGQKLTFSLCVFNNQDIIVNDVPYGNTVVESLCFVLPNAHNKTAWVSLDKNFTRWKDDEVNGGFSPALDAFYGATVVKKLYEDWYHVPVLVEEDGKTPMKLVMNIHYGRHYENAYWDGKTMTFGDGDKMFYPLTSLDVTAHEISHGFTSQHSNLDGENNAMGGLHESFSDMAAAATQYYLTGKNTWDMGRDIMKGEGALRYMDKPSKDGSSVEHMKDFDDTVEVHDAAGIFNKAFYLIATSKGWDTHKAFDIMVKANMDYWTSSMTTFTQAACGVVSATKDLAIHNASYNVADVRVAFSEVGIKTDKC